MKFKDLVIYNLLVESFQDEGILLTESIELSKALQDIVKDKNLGDPKPPVKSKVDDATIKVDLKDDQQLSVDDGSKIQEIKIGKVLQRMWPDLDTAQSNEIIGRIRAKMFENIVTFTIEDNVSEWYKSGKCGKVKSCMTDKPELTKFYDTQDSLKIVIAWRNEKPIGRALLWHNVKGAENSTYLDQVYPNDDNTIKELFKTFADKNEWTFFTEKENLKLVYTLENKDKIDKIPYLDTFRYGTLSGRITNQRLNIYYYFDSTSGRKFYRFPDWVIRAKLGPDVSLIPAIDNRVIFQDGTWINGTWEDGRWNNGTWKNGTWKNGSWENGNWRDGVWENGWHGGGTWENGIWKNGHWYLGVWLNGIWENGTWSDGRWKGGTWKNGTWRSGTWNKGTWEGGKWVTGTWITGTWKDGVWNYGFIFDPDKVGNFKPNWEWKDKYVASPISPKEYFAK